MLWYQELIASISSIIAVLLAVIGYFLKKQIDAIRLLEKTVQALYLNNEIEKVNFANSQNNCLNRHSLIDESIEDHEKRISVAETNIAILKEKTK